MGQSYEKLVRDKIPEILDAKGVPYEKRIADDAEYRDALIKKLQEEVTEFVEDGSPEELADVLEVVDALCALPAYTQAADIQTQKYEERGGFRKRIILKGEKD